MEGTHKQYYELIHLLVYLMCGRDLLSKGFRWNVGDCLSIKVWDDPSILNCSNFRTFPPSSENWSCLKVKDLIDAYQRK